MQGFLARYDSQCRCHGSQRRLQNRSSNNQHDNKSHIIVNFFTHFFPTRPESAEEGERRMIHQLSSTSTIMVPAVLLVLLLVPVRCRCGGGPVPHTSGNETLTLYSTLL